MLMSRPRSPSAQVESASVHNYYEQLVAETILHTNTRANSDGDFMADISCVALNHLPPRYIRHNVDMSFFMSPAEREETADKVQQAVDHAIEFVLAREQEKHEAEDNTSPAKAQASIQQDTAQEASIQQNSVQQATSQEASMQVENDSTDQTH